MSNNAIVSINVDGYNAMISPPEGSTYNNSFAQQSQVHTIGRQFWNTSIVTVCGVYPFKLPFLGANQSIVSASLSFYYNGYTIGEGTGIYLHPTANIDLYALRSSTYPVPNYYDYYSGTNDTGSILLDQNFIGHSSSLSESWISYSGSNLLSFINSAVTSASSAGVNTEQYYVFFRLNYQLTGSNGGNSSDNIDYTIVAGNSDASASFSPVLNLTISGSISPTPTIVQFSYNLPTSSIVSAAVYDKSKPNNLIRTLFGGVPKQAGVNYDYWDGCDDTGSALPLNVPYRIKLLAHNINYNWDGIIGNSSLQSTESNVYKGYINPVALAYSANSGKVYYCQGYNELQPPFHYFQTSSARVTYPYSPFGQGEGSGDDSNSNFAYVASDGNITYWARTSGNFSSNGSFVVGSTGSNNSFVPFAGSGVTLANLQYNYPGGFDYNGTQNSNVPSGLAVQPTGNFVFVAHNTLNEVKVFNKISGSAASSPTISVTQPYCLATDASNNLWVMSNSGSSATINYYTINGSTGAATLSKTISSAIINPLCMSVSADGTYLLVMDAAPSNQLKAFSTSTNSLIWTYGQYGGNDAIGPNITTSSFSFSTPTQGQSQITFLPDNSFWVIDSNNFRVCHYATTGSTVNYIENIMYIGGYYNHLTTADINNPNRVFSGFLEFNVDYTKPLSNDSNGSWTFVKNWRFGLTNDVNHNYFGNAVVEGFTSVTTINGHTYGLVFNGAPNNYTVFELPQGNSFLRDTGVTQQINYTCQKILKDGSIKWAVENPNIFYETVLTSIDGSGNPVWGTRTTLAQNSQLPHQDFANGDLTLNNVLPVLITSDQPNTALGHHLCATPYSGSSWIWQTAKNVPLKGEIVYFQNPQANDYVSIGNATYTFVNSGATGKQVNTGSNLSASMAALSTKINSQYSTQYITSSATPYSIILTNLSSSAFVDVQVNSLAYVGGTYSPYYCDVNFCGFGGGQGGNNCISYGGIMPTDGKFDIGNGVIYPASDIMVMDRNIIWGYHGEFWKNGECNYFYHYRDDGMFLKRFGVSQADIYGNLDSSAKAGMAGNSLSPLLVKYQGNLYIYHGDENTHGGIHRWSITNTNSILEYNADVVIGGSSALTTGSYYTGNGPSSLRVIHS